MDQAILKYRQRLDFLYKKAEDLQSDAELLSEWTKYLCVLTCGFIEQSVKIIYGNYLSQRAHPYIVQFARRTIDQFKNPKMERICQLAERFSTQWADCLRHDTEGELKDAVDSIVANRHLIAHGRDVGLTFARMRTYYAKALAVLKLLNDQTT